jgi:hypothetical protein
VLDVPREAEVADHQRAPGTSRDVLGGEHRGLRAGAAHHDVGHCDRGGDAAHRHRPRGHTLLDARGGDSGGLGLGAVGDGDLTDPGLAQLGGGERAHRTGADDQRVLPRDVPGSGERLRHDRGAQLVQTGLGVHSLADPQGGLDQLVQRAAHSARVARGGVRGADLAEDLGLADDHRVQPGGDREQVLDRRARVVDVQRVVEVRGLHPGLAGQHVGYVVQATVEGFDDGVDLDAVARGDQHGLADVLGLLEFVQHLGHFGRGDRGALQGAQLRAAM